MTARADDALSHADFSLPQAAFSRAILRANRLLRFGHSQSARTGSVGGNLIYSRPNLHGPMSRRNTLYLVPAVYLRKPCEAATKTLFSGIFKY